MKISNLLGCSVLALQVILTGASFSRSVVSNTTTIQEGILRYHYVYNDNSKLSNNSTSCSALLVLGTGTAMEVDDYDFMAREIAKANPTAVVAIIDHAPGDPMKISGKRYANMVHAVAARLNELIPACRPTRTLRKRSSSPLPKIFLGGHSASGEAAIHSLSSLLQGSSLTTPIEGFIGLSPFRITDDMATQMESLPTLQWGFSTTTCGVQVDHAADLAYQLSSVQTGRVLYQLQNPSGEPRHCVFANHGCPMCPACPAEQQDQHWIHPAVGQSIAKFITALKETKKKGTKLTRESMKLSLPDDVIGENRLRMFVGEDTIIPTQDGTKSAAGMEIVA